MVCNLQREAPQYLSSQIARSSRMQTQTRKSLAQAAHEKALWARIHRSNYYDPSKGIQMNIRQVSQIRERHTSQADRDRFSRWRHKMENDKDALRWLLQERMALHSAVKQDPDGDPGGNLQESLRNLQAYWKTIWERQDLDIPTIWDEYMEHTPAQPGPAQWPAVSVDHIKAAVHRAKGTARAWICGRPMKSVVPRMTCGRSSSPSSRTANRWARSDPEVLVSGEANSPPERQTTSK